VRASATHTLLLQKHAPAPGGPTRMVRSCWAGVLLVGTFDAAFTSSSLILSVSWATRVLRYASSSEAEVIGDGDVLVGGCGWMVSRGLPF
jgi:hypothetical protein